MSRNKTYLNCNLKIYPQHFYNLYEYIVKVSRKDNNDKYNLLFIEKTSITTQEIYHRYNNNDESAISALEIFTISKARARIALGDYKVGETYLEKIDSKNFSFLISEDSNIDDSFIKQKILVALQNIRKADPNRFNQIPLDVNGFCHLLEISNNQYLYNASILSEDGMIEENTVLGKSIDEGYIYITSNGIDFLKSITNELNVDKQKSEKEKDKVIKDDFQNDEHITQLNDLFSDLEIESEREFLNEAIDCYKVNAYRATIVLVWILTIDHLYEYILKHKLNDFNNKLNDSHDKNLKGLKIKVKDDFCDIPEKKFIDICRSAKITTKEPNKILLKELDTRNSYAHPSGTKVTQTITKAFIENLIHNIILKYKI